MPQWVFYLVAMFFDAVTCAISTVYLLRSASGINRFVGSCSASGESLTPFMQHVRDGEDVRDGLVRRQERKF